MATRHEVHIANTGEAYGCTESRSLLEGMEALSRRGIPVGCRGGGCGVCKVRIATGTVQVLKMSRCHVSVEEEAAGVVLACRAYPRSDVRLEAVDAMATCIERSHERSFLATALAGSRSSPPEP